MCPGVMALAYLIPLAFFLSVHRGNAADFDIRTLPKGQFIYDIGDTECPSTMSFDQKDYSMDAADIAVDEVKCVGAKNVLLLTPDERELGTPLTKHLRKIEDLGPVAGGPLLKRITCNGTGPSGEKEHSFESGAYFQFFSPLEDFKVTFAEILAPASPISKSITGTNTSWIFNDAKDYFIYSDRCIYSRKTKGRGYGDEDKDPATKADDHGSACFPGEAMVQVKNGSRVRMDSLSVGDSVQVSAGEYSPIFMFTHKLADVISAFVEIETAHGRSIALSPGHYLYANGAPKTAAAVRVGDVVTLASGEDSYVTRVRRRSGVGLHNPQTVHGDIVVDGVMSTCYTSAVEPALAHAVLAPFRFLHRFGYSFTALEAGVGSFVAKVVRSF